MSTSQIVTAVAQLCEEKKLQVSVMEKSTTHARGARQARCADGAGEVLKMMVRPAAQVLLRGMSSDQQEKFVTKVKSCIDIKVEASKLLSFLANPTVWNAIKNILETFMPSMGAIPNVGGS